MPNKISSNCDLRKTTFWDPIGSDHVCFNNLLWLRQINNRSIKTDNFGSKIMI